MDKITASTQSSLHISEEVLATIANEVIGETDGVFALSNLPVRVTVLTAPSAAKPVRISINAGVAQIDVGIVVNLNYRLKEVCEQVQASIKDAVQNMTGIAVSKVNVFVTGVHVPSDSTEKSQPAK